MRYIFKLLVLGNPSYTPFYITNSFLKNGEEKGTYLVWYKEINVFEDVCDLEIDVINNMIDTDFDEILPETDGILYFLNPRNEEEKEYFELILPVINSVKRDIPTIIIYYDPDGIIPISVTHLLENVWLKYPQLEAFVNVSPKNFHQPLQCLCLAMISGDTPLNIENAWMRFPIYIILANLYFEKNQYYYAAQAIRKAAMIAEIFNKEEYYVISEQAAALYSKVNLYLEASKILQNIDKRKSENFKKLYAESILLEGNKLFNKKKYESAARQYLLAAQWAAIEIKDRKLKNESFRLAINSWISACKVENAFKIFAALPHEGVIIILKEIADKIVSAAEFLEKQGNYISAKDQLYKAISVYQREGLFDELEKFTNKQVEVLTKLLELQIEEEDNYSAKYTYDEIENLWESYEVKKSNLDKLLDDLIKLFLKELNFGMATDLMNKLNSLSIKKKLTKLREKIEEEAKEQRKKEIEINIKRGVEVLTQFKEEELSIINNINEQIIKEANILIENDELVKAANKVKNQANFLKSIGKENLHSEILSKSLDILLIGKSFNQFFSSFNELSEDMKKKYLNNKFQLFLKKLGEIKIERNVDELIYVFENSSKTYRDQNLFEKSNEIIEELIESIKEKAIQIIDRETNLKGINSVLNLINKVQDLSFAYLDNKTINFNELYSKIVEIYISIEDFSSAYAINDRIDNKMLKAELHKKISKFESEKSELEIKKVRKQFEEETLKEKGSIIKKKAREALQDKDRELRQRKAYKRVYFEEALKFLEEKKFQEAIDKYEELVDRLNNIKQYNLAGITLAVLTLILLKENRINEMKTLLIKVKKKLSSLDRIFSETYAITLTEYILDVKDLEDEVKLKNAVSFMENLPLFQQEIDLLYNYLEKEYKKDKTVKELIIESTEIETLKNKIINLSEKIEKEKQDIAKRKLMKNQYWRHALEDISSKKYQIAATEYINLVPQLMIKKFYKQAAVSLIIGSMLMIEAENLNSAKTLFYDKLSKLEQYKSQLEDLPEITLMREIYFVMENNFKELINIGLTKLIERLVLFEPEIEYLESLIPAVKLEEKEEEAISRKERGELNILLVKLEQNFANLHQKLGDVRREKNDLLKKRQVMKKRYYKDLILALEDNDFKKAGDIYYTLANSISKRKDFTTSSLLILLHGLALLKSKQPIERITSNLHQFLKSLGLNKKLVEDTFYIRCINFILDVLRYNMKEFITQINEMLDILPLFEEEFKLKELEL